MTKSPLKVLKRHAKIFAVGYLLVCQTSVVALCDDGILKSESDIHFLGFDQQVGSYASQERLGLSGGSAPTVSLRETEASVAGLVDGSQMVEGHDRVQRTSIYHRDLYRQTIGRSNGSRVLEGLVDGHAALSVEQTGEVDVLKIAHKGPCKISGELGEHPMPGPSVTGAEGQYRTKQGGRILPGVRNEQVPDPKGKVCSDLTGNRESETETISPCVLLTTEDGSTLSNKSDYQKTLNSPVRFIRPSGQGENGDITWKALEYMGKPWYWDRQCPAGRAYFLRTEDTHFVVDPRFLFEWTAPLTYPDQMAFTKLCGLRFFMRTQRRMFECVVDGITA